MELQVLPLWEFPREAILIIIIIIIIIIIMAIQVVRALLKRICQVVPCTSKNSELPAK
jgi:uncharacterized SAM-binding protein YcdF (DUF218 family)